MDSSYKVKNKKSGLIALFLKFSFGGWVSAAISFLTTPIITALFFPEEFGKASMFLLALNLLLQVVLMGTDQSFVRFFYNDKYKNHTAKLLKNSVSTPILLSFAAIFIMLLFWEPISLALINESSFFLSILLSLTLIFSVLERYSSLLIRMRQKATLFSLLKISQSIITVIIIVLYSHFIDRSFYAIIYGTLISFAFTSIFGIIVEKKYWINRTSVETNELKDILYYGLPFLPTFLLSWVFEGVDKLSLRYYSTFNEIGLYSSALKIVAVLTILQSTFSNFWVPVAYEAYEKNSNASKRMFENIFSGLNAIFFIGALLLISFKDTIILVFAEDYRNAVFIMPFLVFIPIMYTLSEVTVGGINFKKKTYWHLLISLISACVNVVGIYLLVPMFGAKGAAISTGIAYITFFYIRTIVANYYFPLNFNLKITSLSIFLLFSVALLNTFSTDKALLLISDVVAFITLITLNKNHLLELLKKYLMNSPKKGTLEKMRLWILET